ncbi:helicase-exonuclease AddAB subunit AddA [Planococcus lenghuensis]|uniref:ATP-dependent helicase/nuclease subunit A n=1 Tax=Planococcus lenghuensis TaxID=2213202 RepID=A0A1Q2L3X1_9BACL|nr:helicase-exonuclease AddAB subunit AddA [Planococcus lenghuensis]AQQ55121.1 helicase-exonuclease AddAB subunit AddA [Planococcus lenghuensis]
MIPTKPANATWTDAQWEAIWAKGQDTLVSAAAGSGKTAVLINRMIERVMDELDPMDVDELLVVTFTNASAAEMRHRMAAALEKALAANPKSQHLRKQLRLINKAQISTLHSFCMQIVRQYAYLLDIDPGFRIANNTEAALLRDDVMAAVLERAYDSEDAEGVYRLADSFTSDRSDAAMETLISNLFDYSRVHPDPEIWLDSVPALYDVPEGFTVDELQFAADLKLSIRHAFEEALQIAGEGVRLAQEPDGPAPLAETFRLDGDVIQSALGALDESWENLFRFMNGFRLEKAAAIRKDSCSPELAEAAKKKRAQLKKVMEEVRDDYFIRPPDRLLQEMREMAPMMRTLTALTKQFAEQYRLLKMERAIVDFADLEHYALQLLRSEGRPSAIAEEYQKRFKEVLVDEYQDINILQETILQLVKSGDERNGNLFMVGDVKQSIYRFRLAEPMLFLGKYAEFQRDPKEEGRRIDLNANFRSRREILDGTNFIFSQIMGERVGEIDYDEAAALKPQAPYTGNGMPVELTLIHDPDLEEDKEELDEELEKSQWEARLIANKVNALMDSGATVQDPWTGENRPLEYRDIVILMRSMTWSGDIADEFKKAGIPLYAELTGGYFDALEVMIMLNTLRVIDNPYQDVPLAAVLRAPFIGLKENELAQIRLALPQGTYYDALKEFIRGGTGIRPDTAEKLRRFTVQLEDWRNLARRGSLADLIWQVYMDTNYLEMAGAMSGGKQRQANLRALHDRALEYEKTSFRGLFRFLRFIDRMKARGDDLGTARSLSERENVVRLMTVHKSKGLEFPVVFLAGMGRSFNEMDFKKSYLSDKEFGLAVKAVNPDTRLAYTSLPFLAVKEKQQLQMRAEEMRVLYVAMTRAKERLYLSASVRDLDKLTESWRHMTAGKQLPDFVRSRAKGFLDWIGPALARHPQVADSLGLDGETLSHPARFRLSVEQAIDLKPTLVLTEETEGQESEPEDAAAEIEHRFNFRYPHQKAVEKRSKQSVTELKRLQALERLEEPEIFMRPAVPMRSTLYHRPDFMQEDRLTAADIGTAVHAVMQHLPLDKSLNAEEVKAFIDELVGRELLTPDEGNAVDPAGIVRFYDSDIWKRLRNAKAIKREVPFTYGREDQDGDHQIVQGIIDCLFEEEDGWVLLDYKTDRTRQIADVPKEMAERYGVQLTAYEEAVENILLIHVKERVLYLFDADQEVRI